MELPNNWTWPLTNIKDGTEQRRIYGNNGDILLILMNIQDAKLIKDTLNRLYAQTSSDIDTKEIII